MPLLLQIAVGVILLISNLDTQSSQVLSDIKETPPIEYFQVLEAQAYIEPVIVDVATTTPVTATSTIFSLIERYAIEYGVDSNVMKKVIKCESDFNPDIQSMHYKNGMREQSYGLSQIHIPSHPYVSIQQAKNPEFAIKFMAENMSKGRYKMWSCYTILKNKGIL